MILWKSSHNFSLAGFVGPVQLGNEQGKECILLHPGRPDAGKHPGPMCSQTKTI